MRIWGPIDLDQHESRFFSWGSLQMAFTRTLAGWEIEYTNRGILLTDRLTESRTILPARNSFPHILPATHDKPILLRPDQPIALSPGTSVHYQVFLPLWIQVVTAPVSQQIIGGETFLDLPTAPLKQTWFGTFESGESAYQSPFLPLDIPDQSADQYMVPLTISNDSSSILWFERFLLRVVHLDLYQTDDGIVSNHVKVAFRGADQFSQISYGDGKALRRGGARQCAVQRQTSSGDLIRKSFLWLRDLAV
ncbi:hypothetical protein AU468_14205 [Alkalispirochaeta sphaeroplastigenens]|uniref:Uncharacterized protein n=1 Tax=Alkalispirochaeta sphaeroplastigenens TaxID=1187066 RepID=A0A2S4JFC0_9SPIO|nr:hypothetical protein [Alkalispirochaeta sphaeroplastigenens]POQ98257.1 hypothetical protein AU468_14205 [Alkalispirochaeta sphaeroplastigenens]